MEDNLNNLLEKVSNTQKNKIFRTNKNISLANYCLLFSFADYDIEEFKLLLKQNKKSSRVISSAKKNIEKVLKDLEITPAELLEKRKAKHKTKKDKIQEGKEKLAAMIEDTTKKLKGATDIFSTNAKEIKKKLNEIDGFSDEAIMNYYKQTFIALIQKAMGKAEEIKTSTAYIVEEDEDGNIISKRIKPNQKGELVIHEEVKKLPADGKAFGEALIVLELIQILEGKSDGIITEDEEYEMYLGYLSQTNTDKSALKGTSGKYDKIDEENVIEAVVEDNLVEAKDEDLQELP